MTSPGPESPSADAADLPARIRACRLCAEDFRATATAHEPNPVVWLTPGAPVLVMSQAPGMRVHVAKKPFWDRSGDRLRDWMGVDRAVFYDRDRVAVLPSAFCFPGYDANGSDLPPPPVCARTWRAAALAYLGRPRLTLLVGGYAQRLHLGTRGPVTATVRRWRDFAPAAIPLPHPSWRNTGWMKRNPWFEAELVPELRARVRAALGANAPAEAGEGR